jgi:hypothetical protein
MDVRRGGRGSRQALPQAATLQFEFVEPVEQGRFIAAILDYGHNVIDLAFHVCQAAAIRVDRQTTLAVETVHLLGVGAHGLGRDLGRQEPVLQALQYPHFKPLAADRARVGAGAGVDVV